MDTCEIWPGRKDKHGYGRFKMGPPGARRDVLAHRWEFARTNGFTMQEIKGWEICHTCDNPGCVKQDHLFRGTHAANMADMAFKDRSTHSEKNPNAKLTAPQVLEIRSMRARGAKLVEIARKFGINIPSVSMIVHRKTWKRI